MTTEEIAALPPADAEQQHVRDEIDHPRFVDAVHDEFARRCGERCACQPLPGEAGR